MAFLGAFLALAHIAYLIWLGATAPSGTNLDPTASPLAFARISSLLKQDILILAGSVSIGLLAQITDNLSKLANGTDEKTGKT
ncbi:MAG: hypothetical protein EBT13_16850 [Rhodobacteraceae bacterium]|nr:hypothetical protein [Paracoccaceae bacterium]